MEIDVIFSNIYLMSFSFLFGGFLCYCHWLAMLMSYLAMRVTQMPFHNMQELYQSDYKLTTVPGSSYWDAFKYGDELWQQIFKDNLQPFQRYNEIHATSDAKTHLEWLLLDLKNAAYRNYYDLA